MPGVTLKLGPGVVPYSPVSMVYPTPFWIRGLVVPAMFYGNSFSLTPSY